MKTKKFEKKLELNKTTIADLGMGDLEKIKGGATGTCISIVACPNTNPTKACPSCRVDINTQCV